MKTSEITFMCRLISVIAPLALIITLVFNTAISGEEIKPPSCLRCHEDIYMKAASYRYRHSVVTDRCPVCHINHEETDNVTEILIFPPLQRESLIYLGQLSEDRDYQAEVTVTDRNGNRHGPERIDIDPENVWELDRQRSSLKLKELSGVMVNEIKKRGFAGAVISWNTDVFATSEIEYGLRGKRPGTYKINDLYTTDHKIMLNGLKHKSRYGFRAVSRDIYGNMLKSREYTFDTSEEFSRVAEPGGDDLLLPVVEHVQVFRITEDNGVYLKVYSNKLSEVSVTIKEFKKIGNDHGFGLLPARYSRIDVCYKCHPLDASHPVGVKAQSPTIKTPDGLPTIEDGIITCVTCHNPHGGERLYYTRFDYNKDLCMRCHLQKYAVNTASRGDL